MKFELRCNNVINPVGIDKTPFFSWICKTEKSEGTRQISYKITVFSSDGKQIWNSGNVISNQTSYVYYNGPELSSHTRYFWNVFVETECASFESEKAFFVTALKDEDISASWIGYPDAKHAPLLFKEIELDSLPEEAFASVTGLGYFELYINGRKVGNDYLVPDRTDYDTVRYEGLKYEFGGETKKTTHYLTYDVKKYLTNGKNLIEIMLGNGFYKQNGRITEGTLVYSDLKAFFQLSCDNLVFVSDKTWIAKNSKMVYNNLFYGEIFDAGYEDESPVSASVLPAPKALFAPQIAPADKIIKTIKPGITEKGIYDGKEVMTGFAEILCEGEKDAEIEIFYSENLNEDGTLNFKSTVGYEECDKNQIQSDKFILSGSGKEFYCPRFVWHGFRYFEIKIKGIAKVLDTKVHYLTTGMDHTGIFNCSVDILNKIHSMYHNSMRGNIHGATPMDCPHRERLGYTGDGQLSSDSAMYNYDSYTFYKKWIDDILDAQNTNTGFVPHTAPYSGGGGGHAWGSAIVIVPWNCYVHYGDKEILKKAIPGIRMWLDYLKDKVNNEGLIDREEPGSWCLGEWCLPADFEWSEPRFEDIKIPSELVNTCYYLYCIKLYRKMLQVLELENDIPESEILKIANSVNNAYLNDNCYSAGVQGCELYPLSVNIVPDDKLEVILNHIRERYEEIGYCMDTGILGTKFLFDVLDKNNLNDLAYKILKNDKYPGYGYMSKCGGTSIWETWEGSGSHSHEGIVSFDAWFYFGLAGIHLRDDEKIIIKPYFPEDMDYLTASTHTEFGDVSVKWKRSDGKIKLNVEIPFNKTAKIYTDNDSFIEVSSGITEIEI